MAPHGTMTQTAEVTDEKEAIFAVKLALPLRVIRITLQRVPDLY